MGTAILVAVLSLVGVFGASVAALVSSRHLQARELLLGPARVFARDALAALAALRGITPPSPRTPDIPHRNEVLLDDIARRQRRIERSIKAIDLVRLARADVRVVFGPTSAAAEYTRRVLEAQRHALEVAERYYFEAENQGAHDLGEWRRSRGADLRESYKFWRSSAYAELDRYFLDVAKRARFPAWRRGHPPPWHPVAIDARLFDASGNWSEWSTEAKSYAMGFAQLERDAKSTGRRIGYLHSVKYGGE